MPYKGERARPLATDRARCFEVSEARIDADGHVSEVLWGEVDAWVNQVIGTRVVATAAEVVDALDDGAQVVAVFPPGHRVPVRPFVVVERHDGRASIELGGAPSAGRNLDDLATLND